MAYKSFIPTPAGEYQFKVDDAKLSKVAEAFEELNGLLPLLSEEERLQLIRMEANDSWRLADERPANPFSFAPGFDKENVDNIVRATVYGEEALEELPISTRLIRNIHYLICAGADYDRKYRGEYRKSPVWIGNPGAGLAEAEFVPPVGEDMTAAITDLDNYINYSDEDLSEGNVSEEKVSEDAYEGGVVKRELSEEVSDGNLSENKVSEEIFIRAAVIHYQFEMIHPFVDGNGRTGRLLNNLFLTEHGALPAPVLLLSHILLGDYNQYCAEIRRVNETGNLTSWISYWLDTLLDAATYTCRVLSQSSPV